eukprot:3846621-Ditylum_brightwellii.AAC.1
MQKIAKCKPVDTAEGKFDLTEALLEGDALMHWHEFKQVEIAQTSKNPDGMDMPLLGMCNPTSTICLQELETHYFPKNLAHLQKAYLHNHIRKPNKLSIKNTAAQLCGVNSMLAIFPVPGNNPLAEDELCHILYRMVKHD